MRILKIIQQCFWNHWQGIWRKISNVLNEAHMRLVNVKCKIMEK